MLNRIGRTCISPLQENTSVFMELWVTARFDVFLKSLNVTKTISYLSCTFPFFEKAKKCLMLLGIMHAASPLPKASLTPSYQQQKNWPKISVAYFTKWFQSIFTVGGWRTHPFNLPLLAPAYIPTQFRKDLILKLESGSSPTLIFEARFRPESQIYRGS